MTLQPWSAAAGQLRQTAAQFLTLRSWIVALGHAAVFVLAYWLAYYLRFGLTFSSESLGLWWSSLGWVVGLQLLVFCLLGQFHGWWRYVTFADLTALLRGRLSRSASWWRPTTSSNSSCTSPAAFCFSTASS